MMLTDPTLFARCSNILETSYFDKKFAPAVGFIIQFSISKNDIPTPEIVNAKFGTKFFKVSDMNQSHKDWFLDTTESFCKTKALEAAVLKGAELIEKGHFGELEKIVKDATLVSLQREMGTDYFKNPKERLKRLLDQAGTLNTGWPSLDEVIYNIGRGELVIFTAISGGGKSVGLQNLTLNWALQGHNVVYFTLELSEELVSKRLDAMLTGIPNSQIFKRLDEVTLQVMKQGKNKSTGKITVKYLPPGCTPLDIKSYLREYSIQKGHKPDMIVIDYMDLMKPNERRIQLDNLSIKDKLISEALRGMAGPDQFDLVVASASQVNRGGYGESVMGMDNIAGGLTKMYTADLVIHINNTSALRNRGQIEFQLMKTRNSGGKDKIVTLSYNIETLRITDEGEGESKGNSEAKHLDELEKNYIEKTKNTEVIFDDKKQLKIVIDKETGEILEETPMTIHKMKPPETSTKSKLDDLKARLQKIKAS